MGDRIVEAKVGNYMEGNKTLKMHSLKLSSQLDLPDTYIMRPLKAPNRVG